MVIAPTRREVENVRNDSERFEQLLFPICFPFEVAAMRGLSRGQGLKSMHWSSEEAQTVITEQNAENGEVIGCCHPRFLNGVKSV